MLTAMLRLPQGEKVQESRRSEEYTKVMGEAWLQSGVLTLSSDNTPVPRECFLQAREGLHAHSLLLSSPST